MSKDLNNIYILNITNANYYCIINRISKKLIELAKQLLQNIDLTKKVEYYKK